MNCLSSICVIAFACSLDYTQFDDFFLLKAVFKECFCRLLSLETVLIEVMLRLLILPILVSFLLIERIDAGGGIDEVEEYLKTVTTTSDSIQSNATVKVDESPMVTYLVESAFKIIYGPNWRSSLAKYTNYSEQAQYESGNWRAVFSNDMDTNGDGVLSQQEVRNKIFSGMELIYNILSPGFNHELNIKSNIQNVFVEKDDLLELANFFLDIIPERYFTYDYGYYLDEELDGLISVINIVSTLNLMLESESEELNDEAVDVIQDVFSYLDSNNDDELTINDSKPKLNDFAQVLFNFVDQQNDGRVYLSEITTGLFNFEYEDIAYVLDIIKLTGDIDLNHFLVPFGFDINDDGVINYFDFYFLAREGHFNGAGLNLFITLEVLKLIDQDQNGVYKSDEIQNFVSTLWNLLDSNKDKNVSLDDVYRFLKKLYNVNDAKMMILEDYVNKIKNYLLKELQRFATYAFEKMNQNQDDYITWEEFYQMPMLCLKTLSNDSCFQSNDVPTVPMTMVDHYFFSHLQWTDRSPSYYSKDQILYDFAVPFLYYILESAEFYPKKGIFSLL